LGWRMVFARDNRKGPQHFTAALRSKRKRLLV
jgi:hypothetical protein